MRKERHEPSSERYEPSHCTLHLCELTNRGEQPTHGAPQQKWKVGSMLSRISFVSLQSSWSSVFCRVIRVINMPPKGSKRKTAEVAEKSADGSGGEENGQSVPKLKKKSSREEIPSLENMDFTSSSQTEDSKPWNVKIASWNINGIRAWMEKNGISYLTAEKPDVLCLQETKCDTSKIPSTCEVEGYHAYWSSGDTEGYAGTGMYCKTKPLNVTFGIDSEKHDKEGRTITAEFDNYYVVTAYVPNSGRGLPRLDYRIKEWDVDFRAYLKKLDEKKPVIMCGDLNVAHTEIDLKNPKGNKKTAGFTPQERESFTELLDSGYFDSFRHLYPEETDAYTFWTYMGNARGKNVGWRLDYFVLSERLKDKLCDSVIRKDVMGSDHCPIALFMAM